MKEKVDMTKIPQHIAVIMDGNGRWAKKQGIARVFGHRSALKAVREIIEGAAEVGVQYLTLYAFSTENWTRPKIEINALMQLLVNAIRDETPALLKNNIKLNSIGDLSALPGDCQVELEKAIADTRHSTGMVVTLALSYSGRWDILNAVKALAADIKAQKIDVEDINDRTFANYLNTYNIPDPELIIRTSGEMRISNFLLWQIAYSEFFFTDIYWPDFRKQHLFEALIAYQSRERRFGKISDQLVQP